MCDPGYQYDNTIFNIRECIVPALFRQIFGGFVLAFALMYLLLRGPRFVKIGIVIVTEWVDWIMGRAVTNEPHDWPRVINFIGMAFLVAGSAAFVVSATDDARAVTLTFRNLFGVFDVCALVCTVWYCSVLCKFMIHDARPGRRVVDRVPKSSYIIIFICTLVVVYMGLLFALINLAILDNINPLNLAFYLATNLIKVLVMAIAFHQFDDLQDSTKFVWKIAPSSASSTHTYLQVVYVTIGVKLACFVIINVFFIMIVYYSDTAVSYIYILWAISLLNDFVQCVCIELFFDSICDNIKELWRNMV